MTIRLVSLRKLRLLTVRSHLRKDGLYLQCSPGPTRLVGLSRRPLEEGENRFKVPLGPLGARREGILLTVVTP